MVQPLQVRGTNLYAGDERIVLHGASSHGLAWYPNYINEKTFAWLKQDFHINAVRLAMYTAEDGGFCTSDEKQKLFLLDLIDKGVKAAIKQDLYVMIDWHILLDNNPLMHLKDALVFFKFVAEKYANIPNVIYEICNEPNGLTGVEEISEYAKKIIPVIRERSPKCLIVVGTPYWSQRVDQFALAPLPFPNLMYSLHFYASTHGQDLMSKVLFALSNGLPVMVSEFGVSQADGNGAINVEMAKEWFTFIKESGFSSFFWAVANRNETACIIKPTCRLTSQIKDRDLTQGGLMIKDFSRSFN